MFGGRVFDEDEDDDDDDDGESDRDRSVDGAVVDWRRMFEIPDAT